MTPPAITPAARGGKSKSARRAASRSKPDERPAPSARTPSSRGAKATARTPSSRGATATARTPSPRAATATAWPAKGASSRAEGHRASARPSAPPRRVSGLLGGVARPRRVSGPAAPARPARPARRPARTAKPAVRAPLTARAVAFVRALPDHPLLDRIIRGRVWIPLLGVLLAGIVAMQVEVLRLSAGRGRSLERGTALQSRNQQLRASVAELSDDQRIESLAAGMGMMMPAPDAVHFLNLGGQADVVRALSSVHAPDASAFISGLPLPGATAADTVTPVTSTPATSTPTTSTPTTGAPTTSSGTPATSPATGAPTTSTGTPATSTGAGSPVDGTGTPTTTGTPAAGAGGAGTGTQTTQSPAAPPTSTTGAAGLPTGG
jgi:hypothetical protein